MQKPDIILLFSDASGVYIPQRFAKEMNREFITGVSTEDWAILEEGPDNELYWETWFDTLDRAKVKYYATGTVYTFYQDGDLFAIPDGMQWDDNEGFFAWPDESE